jgi:hypothetical protein
MKRWVLPGVALLVAGCANLPQQAGLATGSRVGIVNLMRPQLSHYNAGADQLSTFDKRYATSAGLPEFVLARLRQELRGRYHYVHVVVEPPAEVRAIGKDVLKRLQAGLNDVVLSAAQQIAREHRLDHVLFVGEVCAPVPPPRTGEKCGYGLYSERTATGASRAFAYFNVAVLRVEPDGRVLRPLTLLEPAATMRELAPDLYPRDVEQLTADELHKIEPFLRELALRRIADTATLVR